MDFIGSPIYYFICGAAFAALVIWLILLQKKPEKKTPPPPPPSRPRPSKPRYAAGSDMDKINRNARMIDLEQESSRTPYRLIGIIIIIIFVLLFIASITSR